MIGITFTLHKFKDKFCHTQEVFGLEKKNAKNELEWPTKKYKERKIIGSYNNKVGLLHLFIAWI